MRRLLTFIVLYLVTGHSWAAMQVRPVEWTAGTTRFAGALVYDTQGAPRRPGVLMVPDWLGVTPAAIEKAKQQAGRDYVVLVVDMYGQGVRPRNADEAKAQVMQLYPKPLVMRERMQAALAALQTQARNAPLDVSRIAAFGFCFGGSSVLELARSGVALAGVVSLHGGLNSAMPAAPGSVRTPILVLNGADDEGQKANILPFEQEMDSAGADWQFVNFSGAEHCFALETAHSPGCQYNERAARRAYLMMHGFFKGRFGMN